MRRKAQAPVLWRGMLIGKRAMLQTGAALAAVYVALAGTVFFKQRAIVFPAPAPREPVFPDGDLVRTTAGDGRPVFALHMPAKADAPTLVFFHGNGEQLDDLPNLIRAFAAHGVGTFAIEYPGYGLAKEQSVSELAIYDSGEAGIRYLGNELGVARERIVLVGQSLARASLRRWQGADSAQSSCSFRLIRPSLTWPSSCYLYCRRGCWFATGSTMRKKLPISHYAF